MLAVHEQHRCEQRFLAEIHYRMFIHPEAHVTALAGHEELRHGFYDGVGVRHVLSAFWLVVTLPRVLSWDCIEGEAVCSWLNHRLVAVSSLQTSNLFRKVVTLNLA